MTPVMESMVFHALVEKYTKSKHNCIAIEVILSEAEGAPCLFSLVKSLGKVQFSAAACGIWAVTMVQASQLVKTEITKPMFISHEPHLPTACSKIPAVEGLAIVANSL